MFLLRHSNRRAPCDSPGEVAEADDVISTLHQARDHRAAPKVNRIRSARVEVADVGKVVAS